MELTREVLAALAAAFPDDELDFLPRATSGGKALGLPYIDARDVMRRLDAVVGPANWSFDYDLVAPDGKFVKGKLTVCGVTKCDAGEGSTEDEVLKSAVSDALKRCAVHFGVGRYLYYLPKVWAPYDAQRRQFTEKPRLSPAAVERALTLCGAAGPASRPAPAPQPHPRAQAAVERAERPAPESNGDLKALKSQIGDLYKAMAVSDDPADFWRTLSEALNRDVLRWNELTPEDLHAVRERLAKNSPAAQAIREAGL